MKASKLLTQRYVGHLCYAMEAKEEEVRLKIILVLYDFPDVFPKESPGLPPQ